MKDVLGITPREVQETLVEMGQTMIEKGLVVKKVKKSKVFVHPIFLALKNGEVISTCLLNEKCCGLIKNKKVLLRERKRHTARRVAIASPCYSGGGGDVPRQKFFSPV